jgi:hypothetical protein
MFQEFQIARAKHAEWDAQYNSAKMVEGMTVEVLNMVDRTILAIRTALAHLMAGRPHAELNGSRAAAK